MAAEFFTIDEPINPGNAHLFPWLSKLAIHFDSYLFNSLSFEYVPSCATTTSGSLTMAIDYDPTDVNDVNTVNLSQMAGSVTSQVFNPFECHLNKSSVATPNHKFYTSSEDTHDNDARFQDVGRFQMVASTKTSDIVTYGLLYVNYNVTLVSPQDLGHGYSNFGKLTTTTGSTMNASNPIGTTVSAIVPASVSPTPDPKKQKVARIVKIINDVATVIGKITPFIGVIAKSFLLDYTDVLTGFAYGPDNEQLPILFSDVPSNVLYLLNPTQRRAGTVHIILQGTYTPPAGGYRPYIAVASSSNVSLSFIYRAPDASATYATATSMYVSAMFDYKFESVDTSKAWFSFGVYNLPGGSLATWLGTTSADANYVSAFVRANTTSF